MSPTQNNPAPFEEAPAPIQVKLAAAWTTFMFLYVYVDILGLYLPGVVDNILEGRVWELQITQGWAFGAFSLMAVPISMIALSAALPARLNRRASLVVAPAYVVLSVANIAGESWTYYFTLAIGLEVLVLATIIRLAWTWPRATRPTADGRLAAAQA